jgi:hypothetical protein
MNIGWAGVVFLWVILLWPIILALAYIVWKKEALPNKLRFLLISVPVGYLALFAGNILSGMLLSQFPEATGVPGTGNNPELLSTLALVAMAILFVLPALTTFVIARRFTRDSGT